MLVSIFTSVLVVERYLSLKKVIAVYFALMPIPSVHLSKQKRLNGDNRGVCNLKSGVYFVLK